MAQTSTKPSLKLKLLIDTKANSVLFAEAGKDSVDFLFSLISLPIATVIRLLPAAEMIGSLGTVYHSLENLSDTYFQPQADKAALLNPKAAIFGVPAKLLSLPSFAQPKVYKCGYCGRYASFDCAESCPSCSQKIDTLLPFAKSSKAETEGYVKDVVTYMVMDDLEVKPMSTISTIALINKYGIREIGDLEEKLVSIGMDEGLKLLKASLESKTVLTDVFLGTPTVLTDVFLGRQVPHPLDFQAPTI